jgi:hypothetical protein
MNRTPLTDADRVLIRHCGKVWNPRRRVGQHTLHIHELTPTVRRMLRCIARDAGMRLEFHTDPVDSGVIRYLLAMRRRWYGPRPPRPERKTTP